MKEGEELFNAKEKIRQQENIIQRLQNETNYLRAQIKEYDQPQEGNQIPKRSISVDNNNRNTMTDLKNKLLISEEKSHQLEEENTKLNCNVQILKQEKNSRQKISFCSKIHIFFFSFFCIIYM